jgi:hypothetical protein
MQVKNITPWRMLGWQRRYGPARGGIVADPKEAIRNAIQAARQSGISDGEIIRMVEEEFTKTDKSQSGGKKELAGDEAGWNPLTEDLKKPKQ